MCPSRNELCYAIARGYILILEARLSILVCKCHIFHKGLNAIYIALEMDESVRAKCAKAETSSRSDKSLVISYHAHSLSHSSTNPEQWNPGKVSGGMTRSRKQQAELNLVLSLSTRENLGPDPFLGDSSVNILSKHILGSAQPLLAALGSWVTLKRQPKFWDCVHVTEVCGRDLLDEVHPHDRTVLPFKEHHHTPKPLNIYLLPNTQRHTLKP